MNIVIFGIGALGSLFGSRLTPLADVTLFGNWPAQIDTLQQHGLTVTHPDGKQSTHRLSVTNDLSQLPAADIALVLVKSYQTERVAQQIPQVLKPNGLVITLQNGLGNFEKLAATVGNQRTTIGVTAQGATMLAPGQLRHAGEGPTHLAVQADLEDKLQSVADLFNQADLPTILVEDAQTLVWGKLAINAGINPLTALLRVPNGDLVGDETLYQVMTAAANEVAQVAAAQGIKLPYLDAGQRVAEVSRATANNRSSMLQDIDRAAPTEIEAISGAIVRLGNQYGVPTPINQQLLTSIKDKKELKLTQIKNLT